MGSALCHLLQVLQRGDAAFAAAENERTAVGSEPIGPVVAHKVLLRPNHILRIEGEMPSIAGFAEGVAQIGNKAFVDPCFEFFKRREHPLPGKDEADVVGDRGADVFDDKGANAIGVACGKLVSIDAAKRVTKENGLRQVQ